MDFLTFCLFIIAGYFGYSLFLKKPRKPTVEENIQKSIREISCYENVSDKVWKRIEVTNKKLDDFEKEKENSILIKGKKAELKLLYKYYEILGKTREKHFRLKEKYRYNREIIQRVDEDWNRLLNFIWEISRDYTNLGPVDLTEEIVRIEEIVNRFNNLLKNGIKKKTTKIKKKR